jgi:hypothetical protein
VAVIEGRAYAAPGPSEGVASAAAVAPSTATALLPAVVRDEKRVLLIQDASDRRVVAAVELVSPANKTGIGRDAHLAKRADYLAGGVNLVEIDLLRGGPKLPLGEPAPRRSDYHVLVGRAASAPRVELWLFGLRDPLPTVPVPLDPGRGDAELSLSDCFRRAFDEGPYARVLDYTRPVSPPLSETDAAWAAEVVRGPAGSGR